MSEETPALVRLRALLREQGGLLASLLDAPAAGNGYASNGHDERNGHAGTSAAGRSDALLSPARVAASGPRAARHAEDYELLVEAIYEGYLLHYGAPRVVRTPEADLRVLAGDRLYALGLARLVALGDTQAVAELADTITLSALAQGAGDAALADAVWAAGARAVGWGASERHARAKALVAERAPQAIEAMRTSAVGTSATR